MARCLGPAQIPLDRPRVRFEQDTEAGAREPGTGKFEFCRPEQGFRPAEPLEQLAGGQDVQARHAGEAQPGGVRCGLCPRRHRTMIRNRAPAVPLDFGRELAVIAGLGRG